MNTSNKKFTERAYGENTVLRVKANERITDVYIVGIEIDIPSTSHPAD